MLTIRYFAAAKAALGVGQESREVAGLTIGEFLRQRAAEAPDAAVASTVLARCSFILNRAATTDRTAPLTGADTLDVLPPFAGG